MTIRPKISKRTFRSLISVVAAVVIVVSLAYAWGSTGHRIINLKAAMHLPSVMGWFKADSAFFQSHASDPDIRRDNSDTSFYAEWPRHFIDIDDYPNFHSLSHNIDSVILLYGWERVKQNGVNPWTTGWVMDSLTAQLARGDTTHAKQTAADLGHYVGDAHQPLHCTVNYNGQFTNNYGIHSRYESSMLNIYESMLSVHPDAIHYVPSVIDFAFSYIYDSNALVESVLVADNFAKAASGWDGNGSPPSSYYTALWNRSQTYTRLQIQQATVDLASLWYTAWVNAGLLPFVANPKNIDFGNLVEGLTKKDSVTVTNYGGTTLIVDSVYSDGPEFSVTPSSVSLPSLATQKFYILFNPTSAGAKSAHIIFAHNQSTSPDTLVVSGTGVALTFLTSPTTLSFADVLVGSTKVESLLVTNPGAPPLVISNVISNDSSFSITPTSANIPSLASLKFYVTFKPLTPGVKTAAMIFFHSIASSPDSITATGSGELISFVQLHQDRWNMISVPLTMLDYTKTVVYPSAISEAFSYQGGYSGQITLANGIGYWLKFAISGSTELLGVPRLAETINVSKGWNLIGSISEDVPASNIISLGTDVVSRYFEYSSGYQPSDTVKAGKAYWVKVSADGKLMLSSAVPLQIR